MSKQIDIEGLAHEIWSAGQLAPEEGIEDGVLRIAQMLVEMQAAERERCSKPMPDEWLVKVRRLVQGFEHVSGLARLWEPDYSSGSERALWSRATEACADVAKLLDGTKKA